MSYSLNYVEIDLSKDSTKQSSHIQVEDIVIKEVTDIVVQGKVYDLNNMPVDNAIVKVFYADESGKDVGYCHVFTDQNGEYMINLPYEVFKGKKVKIKAVKTNKE